MNQRWELKLLFKKVLKYKDKENKRTYESMKLEGIQQSAFLYFLELFIIFSYISYFSDLFFKIPKNPCTELEGLPLEKCFVMNQKKLGKQSNDMYTNREPMPMRAHTVGERGWTMRCEYVNEGLSSEKFVITMLSCPKISTHIEFPCISEKFAYC